MKNYGKKLKKKKTCYFVTDDIQIILGRERILKEHLFLAFMDHI